jgi:hypothetical protein
MEIIPNCVAGVFLFRTLKPTFIKFSEAIKESQTPLLMLTFFLLGELRLSGLIKLLPLFFYIHLQYHNLPQFNWETINNLQLSDVREYFTQFKKLDKFNINLTSVICATGFLTGWFVRDPQIVSSLPINSLFSHLSTYLFYDILICVGIAYSLKFTDKVLLITQLLYLTFFLSSEHLSFLFLFVFILIGLLTKRDQPNSPFLSFYIIEACLTVGTLFTAAPANLFFAVGSLILLWKLSILNDKIKKPIVSDTQLFPKIETMMPTK